VTMQFNLAVPQPTLPPTAEEMKARGFTREQFGKPLSRKRLRVLKAMGKKRAPKEKPDPIIEKMKAEIAAMEAAQREIS
jgi:hypothetical protein